MEKIFENVCPCNCYGTCRMITSVHDGQIVSIEGDPNAPFNKGSLCVKGYSFPKLHSSPKRLLYPLKQHGKGSGKWERISWERALSEIAYKLIKIKSEENNLLSVCLDKYAGNVGLLNQTVNAFFRSIGFVTFMVGSPCNSAGMDACVLSYGSCKKPSPYDMENANLAIIWGGNPAWTHPNQMRYLFESRKRGGIVVVIDPYLTATAARADLYIQIKPGTDGVLALGIARILLDEHLIDESFLNNHTSGWENYRLILKKLDLKMVSNLTGVSINEIYNLATLYGKVKPATIWLGSGAQNHLTGGQNYRAIHALAALTGNIGIPGGNVHYTTAEILVDFNTFNNIEPPPNSIGFDITGGHRKISTGRFSHFLNLSPFLRFLWISGRNPVAQDPDSNNVKDVLQSIETVIVTDTNLTASAKYADYVLPVTTFLEQEDVIISKWHYAVALNEQALSSPGECRSDFDIVRDLALRLNALAPGFSTFPTSRTAGDWIDMALSEKIYARLGIHHYRDLLGKYLTLDIPSVPWSDFKFSTASGKFEFDTMYPVGFDFCSLPNHPNINKPSSAYPIQLISIRSSMMLNSQFSDLLTIIDPKDNCLLLNPLLAKENNISDGDEVCIYNSIGEISLPARLTYSVPQDMVVVNVNSSVSEDNNLNSLISLQDTDLGALSCEVPGMAFKNCYINLYRNRTDRDETIKFSN